MSAIFKPTTRASLLMLSQIEEREVNFSHGEIDWPLHPVVKPTIPIRYGLLSLHGLSCFVGEGMQESRVEGLVFHDLRGTAVMRLAFAGSTDPEIAANSGHSLRRATAFLDAHYLSRDPQFRLSAIRKLEAHKNGT